MNKLTDDMMLTILYMLFQQNLAILTATYASAGISMDKIQDLTNNWNDTWNTFCEKHGIKMNESADESFIPTHKTYIS